MINLSNQAEFNITELALKQKQFNAAMERYNSRASYKAFSWLIALTNVSLQLILVIGLFHLPHALAGTILAFLLAYYLTDLVNGFIHLIMDNHADYSSMLGPLVANFHLHHKIPLYQRKPLLLIYFYESGAKIWLSVYLLLVLIFLQLAHPPVFVAQILVFFGVLSSVAEVSHYLCHTSSSRTVKLLSRLGVLLSKRHHAKHHAQDNMNYAFLNGWSDPLLNIIARKFFSGYKKQTDLHYRQYHMGDAKRRL